ncbi:UNVERIFIED_CONTAM: hypothetical protein HDU68_002954 [Siphonaria sp. JEL0065]|nr:hypothetical protein HDU68_002954 [Siphonaria sp. JEL0065]
MLLSVILTTLSATLSSAQTCTAGAWGCSNNNLSVCQDGKWATVTACAATQGCRAAPYYDCNGPAAGSTTTTTTTKAATSKAGSTTTTTTTKVVPTTTKTVSTTTTTTVAKTSTASAVSTTTASGNLPLCQPKFNPGTSYTKGQQVSYQNINYLATYQTSATPGPQFTGWQTIGPCDPSSLSFRPFDKPGVIGYWTTWSTYSRKQNSIDQLDLTGFTAINYAFMNADANGNVVTFDSWADQNWMGVFNAQRTKYPKLRTIVSIGGWSGSKAFSTIAKSPSLIQTFAKNVHTFLDANGFDGVDIDWEYPGGGGVTCNAVDPDDAANFVNLLKALREELGPTRSISLAVSAEVSHYVDSKGVQQIPNILKYANYAQVMSYDFYGSWNAYSDFNSPLDVGGPNDPKQPASNNAGYSQPLSQKNAIRAWLDAGAKPEQLTNGLGFYGRSWSVQSNKDNGLYQQCTGSVNGAACPGVVGDYLDAKQWCDPCNVCYNSGVWMYNNMRGSGQSAPPLASGPTTASNGWTRQYFDFAQSPTLYTSNYNGKSSFISYDDPVSLKAKAAWAKSVGLGGTMIWELSQDFNKELITAVRAGWGN